MSSHYQPRLMYSPVDQDGPIVGLGVTEHGRIIVAHSHRVYELVLMPDASDFRARFPDSTGSPLR